MSRLRSPQLLCAVAIAFPASGIAQTGGVDSVAYVQSHLEDRIRIDEVLGRRAPGSLLGALSTRLRLAPDDSLTWSWVSPELHVVSNSELPFSQNDGLLWAGRGLSGRVRGGMAGGRGRWRFVLVPEIATATNKAFVDVDVVGEGWNRPAYDPDRLSQFASPWNQHPASADVPIRFGGSPYDQVTLGQSAVWYEGDAIAAGVATENLWWGPGVHDALIMTNNAAGIPHAFVRTARPWRTRIGDFEGRLIIGTLEESDYFDFDGENDHRSLSAAAVTYRPAWAQDLVVGMARAVYAPTAGAAAALGHVLDVFGTFDRPGSRPLADSTLTGGRDQATSVFARYVFPSVGWELYVEAGRNERPANLRDLLTDPGHTLGYVVGTQHVRRVGDASLVRAQLEVAQMEQSTSYRYRPTQSWYTSRAAPQGYTQRGQVIGATIGPGSSHQWFAVDFVAPAWTAGAFVGRWRFNTDAMYARTDFPRGTGWCEFDMTIYPGARGSYTHGRFGFVAVEAIFGTRYNAFHQNNSGCPAPDVGRHLRDVRNRTIRLTLAPRLFR